MFRILPIVFVLAACNETDNRLVGDFWGVDNRTDADLEFFEGAEPDQNDPAPGTVDVSCADPDDLATMLDTDGTLVITGEGDGCVVRMPSDGVVAIAVNGRGDLDAAGTWDDLAYLSLDGDGYASIEAISTDGLAIGSSGARLAIGDLEADRLALDLQGTSETTLSGHADHGWFVVRDSATLHAADLQVEELDVDITDSATVEATATERLDGNIDDSADVEIDGP